MIQNRLAEGSSERIAETVAEFVRLKVDVIVTGGNAVLAGNDAFAGTHSVEINNAAIAARLPTMHGLASFLKTGGLMCYGPSVPAMFTRAAELVDRILKGAKPADMPVEQASVFELGVNLKTAKALGIAIPQTLLVRADEVIQ